MGKKNALLLILSGFIFIYFISLIYIPSNLFNLNAYEYPLRLNKLTGEEYFDFSGSEETRRFNSLRCSNWKKCTMLDVIVKKGDQDELSGKEAKLEFYIEQLKLSDSKNKLITQNKLKLPGIPDKVIKLEYSPDLPHSLDIILSYSINEKDDELNYQLTTVENSEVKFFNINGGLKIEDIYLTSDSLIIKRWGSKYEFEYYKIEELLSLTNNSRLKFNLGPKRYPITDNVISDDKFTIANYFESPKKSPYYLQSIIKLELKKNTELSVITHSFVQFSQLGNNSWTSNKLHRTSLPNANNPQLIMRNRGHSSQYGLYTIRTSHHYPYNSGVSKVSNYKLKLPEKPIYARSGDAGVLLVNNGDSELAISNLDFKIEKLMPYENLGSEFGVNSYKTSEVNDEDFIVQLAPRFIQTSSRNSILDTYFDDEDDDDPYSSSYDSHSSDLLEESIKFAKLSKFGDKLILINNQNKIKLFEKREITIVERTSISGEVGNPRKLVNWLLIREFRVSNIQNDIKGFDLIESTRFGNSEIDNIVLLDSQNKLFYFNPTLTKANSTTNNFKKSSFFLERPLLVTCMTIIVLSFSYVEYLQVD